VKKDLNIHHADQHLLDVRKKEKVKLGEKLNKNICKTILIYTTGN
jgi:hypothetical protein